MDNNLNTQMDTLAEDIFAQLMDEVPEKSVNPASLVGSSKPNSQKDNIEKENKSPKEEKEEEKEREKKEENLSQEELDKQMAIALGEESEEEEETNEEEKEQSTEKKKDNLDKSQSSSILQTQAQLLIDKGLWREFEGMEDFEWNDENYAELVVKQAEWDIEERFSELLDSTGSYGKAIIGHIQNGGNPEEIIDLFKEAKKIESIDTSTEEGKVSLLTKYYKDLGWKDARIKRTIDAAIDSNSIDEDVAEAKAEMEEAIKEEVAAKQKAQEDYLKAQKEAEDRFAENITGALRERKDMTPEQKKEIATSLLVYDKKLPNGRIVNQFTLDFAKLQNDPKKYIDLVLFVKDHDKYIETLSKKEEKKAVKKTWEFVKGNGAAKSSGGGGHTRVSNKDKSDLVIDYRAFN